MKAIVLGILALSAAAIASAWPAPALQTNPTFWQDLKAGPYAVGFRTLYSRDRTRNWPHQASPALSDPGRPIRVSLWYPAAPPSTAQRMNYGDYFHYDGPADFRLLNDQLEKSDRESWQADLTELASPGAPTFEKLLSTTVAAYRNAPAAHGRFPLVLYSGGNQSRQDANVELGEYLASHGYVVAVVPQLGPSETNLQLGSSPQDIALHADDYEAALTVLHTIPEIDFAHIATAGHSAGGEVAIELALRHPDISAVVGLDGSYGMQGGSSVLKRLVEYRNGLKVRAALLDLRRAEGSQGVKLDLEAIDALHWDAIYRGMFSKAFHGDFTEWGMIAFKLSVPMPSNPDGHTRQVGYEVNQHACRAVLDFLDARLRGSQDGLTRLKNEIKEAAEFRQL